jgi:hypothetical protein
MTAGTDDTDKRSPIVVMTAQEGFSGCIASRLAHATVRAGAASLSIRARLR